MKATLRPLLALGVTALFINELLGRHTFSGAVFWFSGCGPNTDTVRRVFVLALWAILFYGTFHYHLVECTGPQQEDMSLLDPLGDGQKNVLFGLGSWQLTHFALYLFLGYMCPDSVQFAFFLGLAFEIVEYILAKVLPRDERFGNYWTTGDAGINWKDIAANMSGFVVGMTIRRVMDKWV